MSLRPQLPKPVSADLENLRAKKKRIFVPDEDSEDDLMQDVTEEEFARIREKRIRDDFVIDDDGRGYADHGEEEDWKVRMEESEEEQDINGPMKGRKRIKRKGDAEKREKARIEDEKKQASRQLGDMERYLTAGSKLAASSGLARGKRPEVRRQDNAQTAQHSNLIDSADILNSFTLEENDDEEDLPKPKRLPPKPVPMKARTGGKNAIPMARTKPDSTALRRLAEPSRPEIPLDDSLLNDIGPSIDDLDTYDVKQPEEEEEEEEMNLAPVAKTRTSAPVRKILRSLPQPSPVFPAPLAVDTASNEGDWFKVQASGETIEESGGVADVNDTKMLFFWLDAWEKDGQIYLFGKVPVKDSASFQSCCISVRNLERVLYILPRQHKINNRGVETDETVEIADVYEEFETVCRNKRIQSWKSKVVKKKYAFEIPGIPAEADYLMILYSYKLPQLASNLTGTTFSKVFGTQTSALEQLLMKCNIMGPCWLEISGATPCEGGSPISWCNIELNLDFNGSKPNIKPYLEEDGSTKPSPPLTVMSLCMKTIQNAKKENEIVVCAMLIYKNVMIDGHSSERDQLPASVCKGIRKLPGLEWPPGFQESIRPKKLQTPRHKQEEQVETCATEGSLLNWMMGKFRVIDPDVLTGHNFMGFDLDLLLQRMKATGVAGANWSRIGRLRRTVWPKLQTGPGGMSESTYQERMVASGRLICDTYLSAKEHIKSPSYSLTTLVKSQLNIDRKEIAFDQVPLYFVDSMGLQYLLQCTERDSDLAMRLAFNMMILPLSKQLTNLAGNMWSRTLAGGRAERNEYLLAHEFYNADYIIPDKEFAPKKIKSIPSTGKAGAKNKKQTANIDDVEENPVELEEEDNGEPESKSARRKPAYAGGLVLEPKKGLYDKYVLMLDFNSLYPSIIQEYNICFTTVVRSTDEQDEAMMPEVPDPSLETGLLPRVIATLVQRRRLVKQLMKKAKDPAEYIQLNLRQQALKLTANSMYGCLGFTHSRFYAKALAMLITMKGREILQSTVDLAEKQLNMNVIYGDTDSIMISTDSEDLAEVKEMGKLLKNEVNKKYKKLEIEMDGFYRRMLLLKKKKYAALLVSEKPDGTLQTTSEFKGLDMVRRDWCNLSHDVSNFVLSQILSGAPKDEVSSKIQEYLRQIGVDIREGKVTLDKFIINKGLTKSPHEYPDRNQQPHVQVALAMIEKGRPVQSGDTIPFVICQSDDKESMARKAHHPDDVRAPGSTLQVDYEYYLQNQIYPPVNRLCQPIDGMDAAYIAEYLGLDPKRFISQASYNQDDQEDTYTTFAASVPDAERFKNVDKWEYKCFECKRNNQINGPVNIKDKCTHLRCNECQALWPAQRLVFSFEKAIRSQIQKYHDYWLQCDDPTCAMKTRDERVYGELCLQNGCNGHMRTVYSDSELYTQLSYYKSIVDVDSFIRKEDEKENADTELMEIARSSRENYAVLLSAADKYLNEMSRSWVNLSKLFEWGSKAPLPKMVV